MNKTSKTVFVIGFPGAVARKVAADLAIEDGTSVRMLVTNEYQKEASSFAASQKGDISIVEGSLEKIDFGLTGEDYFDLASEVGTVLYCYLPSPPGSPSEVVGVRKAVREIIEFALASKIVPKIVFLSHLDVAGNAQGVFAEQDLVLGQGFKGKADEDRFRAERVLGRFVDKLPITVVRTGWIVGRGEGLCPLIEILLAQEDLSSISPKALECTLPFIDSKSISEILVGLVKAKSGTENQTLHVTFEETPRLTELFETTRKLVKETVPVGFDFTTGAKSFLRQAGKETRWSVREFFKHIGDGTRFTNARTKRVLKSNGLAQPLFAEAFQTLVRDAGNRIASKKR